MIGALAALGSSLTWAVGTTVYPALSVKYSPFEVNGSRALVALLFFLPLSLTLDGWSGWDSVTGAHVSWMLLSMVCSYFLGDACFLWSVQSLGVPGALAIASIYPVWTAVAGWLFKGEALGFQQGAGIALAVLGTLMVILSGYRVKAQGVRYGRGVAFGLLTSGFWALNSWAVAEGGAGISPWVGNSIRMGIALFLCGVTASALRRQVRVGLPIPVLKPYLAIFAFEAFGGSFFFLYGLTHASLAVASALSSLAPVIAVPLAWLRKSEPLTPSKVMGVLLAVAGVVILLTA